MKRNKKGFTIVELVIVIGVIGILSAILIPTFANLTTKANEAALKSDLAAVYAQYVDDVADGYYGDPEAETPAPAARIYGQNEVAIVKGGDYYVYDANGWNTTPIAEGNHSSYTLANAAAVYNGFSVYLHN